MTNALDLRYREMTEPDFPRLPVRWEGTEIDPLLLFAELITFVQRREYVGDLTVGWAEVYDHNTGKVMARYEHPRLHSPTS